MFNQLNQHTMYYIPAYLRAWHRHICFELSITEQPSAAEVAKPLRFDYELYGRYLAARQQRFNQLSTVIS